METSASFEARSAPLLYPMEISLSGSGEGPGRATSPGYSTAAFSLDVSRNLGLQSYAATPPCPSFQFHKEYGTAGSTAQLLPGAYTVSVSAIVDGKMRMKTVAFDVQTCDFNPTVVVST